MFSVDLNYDQKRRRKALILSAFLPGSGQIATGRMSGVLFLLIFPVTALFLYHVRSRLILTNGLVAAGYLVLYIVNLIDAYSFSKRRTAACQNGCPARIDIPTYISLIADRRFEEAKAVIRLQMPLVSVCGTICTKECEPKCVRAGFDEPVMIMSLKKSCAPKEEALIMPERPKTRKRAAIVGAGPSGLSLAYFLSRSGIGVTLFEKESECGGLLRYAIPRFRLDMLDYMTDVEEILSDDLISIEKGVDVGRDIHLTGIINEFDYTVLAVGKHDTLIPFENIRDSKRAHTGLEYLKMIAANRLPEIRGRAVVIGGGNVAVDTARTLVRMGVEADIYYRRDRSAMPADADEIREAEEEGISIYDMHIPESVTENEEKTEVHFNVNDEERSVLCDHIIFATGQAADYSAFGIDIEKRGNFRTNYKGLYILEDAGSIVRCASEAKKLSRSIVSTAFGLRGIAMNYTSSLQYTPRLRAVNDAAWNYSSPRHSSRISLASMNGVKRRSNMFKVDRDLSELEAVEQAKRCFRCSYR